MEETQPNNPLHGIKLKTMLEKLVEEYGWEQLHFITGINCFGNRPTINSSLKVLRQNEWARKKIEKLYLKVKSRNQ